MGIFSWDYWYFNMLFGHPQRFSLILWRVTQEGDILAGLPPESLPLRHSVAFRPLSWVLWKWQHSVTFSEPTRMSPSDSQFPAQLWLLGAQYFSSIWSFVFGFLWCSERYSLLFCFYQHFSQENTIETTYIIVHSNTLWAKRSVSASFMISGWCYRYVATCL